MPHCRDCADHNGICPGSGKPCDPADILVEMRSGREPHKTWRELGHLPFEMHGEKFAVTRNVAALNKHQAWRVSHVATGAAIPHSIGATKEEARDAGMKSVVDIGDEKFHAALGRLRNIIACF